MTFDRTKFLTQADPELDSFDAAVRKNAFDRIVPWKPSMPERRKRLCHFSAFR